MSKKATEPIAIRTKDPSAYKVYTLDYNGAAADGGPWLGTGETITASVWVTPAGITAGSTGSNTNTTTTTPMMSQGTNKKEYDLINRISTSNGRREEKTLRIRVRQG